MTQADVNGDFDATMDYPLYQLQAKLASLYLEGKHGLEKDPNCAGIGFTSKVQNCSMSSRVCATGHIKDPVPLIEKSRASCPSGRFPPSFIHQIIIITGLNKLYDCIFSP